MGAISHSTYSRLRTHVAVTRLTSFLCVVFVPWGGSDFPGAPTLSKRTVTRRGKWACRIGLRAGPEIGETLRPVTGRYRRPVLNSRRRRLTVKTHNRKALTNQQEYHRGNRTIHWRPVSRTKSTNRGRARRLPFGSVQPAVTASEGCAVRSRSPDWRSIVSGIWHDGRQLPRLNEPRRRGRYSRGLPGVIRPNTLGFRPSRANTAAPLSDARKPTDRAGTWR